MALPVVQQFLLTRFNVRYSGSVDAPSQSRAWLEDRFDLFHRYCVPTIAAQTFSDFTWVVFCDEATDAADLERIRACDRRIRIGLTASELFDPVQRRQAARRERPGYGQVLWRMDVQPFVAPETNVVISTRLDNDDALHREALRRVRGHLDAFLASDHVQQVYNPMLGYRFDAQHRTLYNAALPSNPFQSRFERVGLRTRAWGALAGNHRTAQARFPYFEDESERLWMMVIHGGNVSNAIRGKACPESLASVLAEFPIRA